MAGRTGFEPATFCTLSTLSTIKDFYEFQIVDLQRAEKTAKEKVYYFRKFLIVKHNRISEENLWCERGKNMKRISFPLNMLLLVTFISLTVFSVNSLIVDSVDVNLNSENIFSINLNQGEKAKGSFSVSETYGIYFKVMDPSGNMVFDRDFVGEGTDFEIIAQETGDYSLVFKNYVHRDSVVNVSYDVESGLSLGPFLWIGSNLIILLIVAVLIVLGIIVLLKRRKLTPK